MGYGEVVTTSIGAKGGFFPSNRVTGKLIDSSAVTRGHGGVRSMTRHAVELQRACGYDELGHSEGFLLNRLHD